MTDGRTDVPRAGGLTGSSTTYDDLDITPILSGPRTKAATE